MGGCTSETEGPSIIPTIHPNIPSTIVGQGFPVYIQDYRCDDNKYGEVSTDAAGNELYQMVRDLYSVSPYDCSYGLKFGETEIRDNDEPLSDQGISPEATFEMFRKPTGELLYDTFENVINREQIPWWPEAVRCHQRHQDPSNGECDDIAYWPGIKTWLTSNDDRRQRIDADNLALSGSIKMQCLPDQITHLYLDGNDFEHVQFGIGVKFGVGSPNRIF